MTHPRLWLRVLSILLVVLLAVLLRLRAVERLPIDYDEDDYLRAGQQFATAIVAGDWRGLTDINYRPEHPPLAKLAYGVALAPLPPAPEIPDRSSSAEPAASLPQPYLLVARLTAAAFGVLEVFALALLNPLAALFLAVHTWEIKYTSQVMLEALPSLTSVLAVLFYVQSKRQWNGWLVLSALAFGVTVASKYLYAVAGIAIVVDWLWARALVVGDSSPQSVLEVRTTNALVVGDSSPQSALKVRTTNTALEAHTTNAAFACWVAPVAAWASLVLVMFFAADPYLWHDPVNRLSESLFFHADYAQSAHVREAGYPLWQPFVWLAGPVPWHPGVFLVAIDLFVTILALLGLPRLWKKQKVFALWLIIALGFLLVWLTKWPQYILILTAPLTLAAAEGFQACVWQPLVAWIRRLRADRPRQTGETNPRVPRREARRALPWLLPGLIALGLMALFPLIFQFAMALTDFNVVSIRDGLTGGVWREVWLGLTGQVQPANLVLSSNFVVLKEARDRGEIYYLPLVARAGSGSPKVNYAGANLLLGFLSGMGADVFVFDVLWTVLVVGLQTALGLGVALMLSQRGVRFKNVWRAIFILPWAIPEFVGALVWLHVFEPSNGWLSLALGTSLGWRDDPQQALVVLLIAALWMGFPLMMVAASAGLKMMPGEVADAAALDGATGWQKFRAITWPLLFPLLAPALIIRAIFAFNQFYLFYVMQAPYPLMSFATVSFFLFDATRGFGGQFAVSAAINIFTVILLIVFIVWLTRWSKAAEGVTYA